VLLSFRKPSHYGVTHQVHHAATPLKDAGEQAVAGATKDLLLGEHFPLSSSLQQGINLLPFGLSGESLFLGHSP